MESAARDRWLVDVAPPGAEPNTKEADEFISRTREVMEHPWVAIERGLVWTLDSTDLFKPIKKFPADPWLRDLTEEWLRADPPLVATPKTRRMMLSWLFVWLHQHIAMFRPGAHVYLQSETETKSNELVERAGFIYDHIPPGVIALPEVTRGQGGRSTTWCKMNFPGIYSFLQGIPQGANQLRQYTASAVMMDEASFWEKGRESFGATKPTSEGGGRITIVSSAQNSWFKDLVFDTIE